MTKLILPENFHDIIIGEEDHPNIQIIGSDIYAPKDADYIYEVKKRFFFKYVPTGKTYCVSGGLDSWVDDGGLGDADISEVVYEEVLVKQFRELDTAVEYDYEDDTE